MLNIVSVCFLLFFKEGFAQINVTRGSLTYNCSDIYDYTQFNPYNDGLRLSNMTSLAFETKGYNDAHILLQYNNSDFKNNVVEIVLGGWNHKQSVIRNQPQGAVLAKINGTILSSSLQWFWISWNDGCVNVGKSSVVGDNLKMSCCNLTRTFSSVRFSYGFGSTGTFVIPLPHKECPADTDEMGEHWFPGRIGFIEEMLCPSGTVGWITRYCDMDGVYRASVYNCTRSFIQDIYNTVKITDGINTTEILSKLAGAINDSNEQLMVGDVEKVRFILQKVASDLGQSDMEPKQNADSFLDVANTLIDEKIESTWKVLVNQTRIGADSIVDSVDKFLNNMVKQSNGTIYNHTFIKSNLCDILVDYKKNSDEVYTDFPSWARDRSNTIRVPCIQDQVYTGVVYRNISRIVSLNSPNDRKWLKTVNAPVISFTYLSSKHATTPVEISFEINDRSLSDPVCAYLQFNESGGPNIWSTEGCSLTSFDRNIGIVKCTCSHLTNFAVLMSPNVLPTEAHSHNRALGVFSIIGCSISMVGLALTVIVHLVFWRSLSSDRTVLLMNVCPIFFIGYIVFLTGIEKTSNSTVCTAIAVVLHYTFFVVFFLMLAEGLMITYLVLRPFRKRRIVVPLIIAAYAIPILIVGISMGVTQLKGYGDESFCWLTVDSGLLWAFAGPIILVVVGNIVNLGIILKFGVCGIAAVAKKSDLEKIKTGARSVGVLTPMFGITWLIGVFAVNDATLVFQWLFVILNSLQGLMIFIVKCPLDKKVQDAFKEKRRRLFYQTVQSSTSGVYTKQKPADDSKQTESSM